MLIKAQLAKENKQRIYSVQCRQNWVVAYVASNATPGNRIRSYCSPYLNVPCPQAPKKGLLFTSLIAGRIALWLIRNVYTAWQLKSVQSILPLGNVLPAFKHEAVYIGPNLYCNAPVIVIGYPPPPPHWGQCRDLTFIKSNAPCTVRD